MASLLALPLAAQQPKPQQGKARAASPYAIALSEGRLAPPAVRDATTRDTLLLTDVSDSNGEKTTITYDEYGRRKLVEDDSGENLRYTYTVGAGNGWTSKLVERKYGSDGSYEPYEKEERTLDAQGRITQRKEYYRTTDGNGQPVMMPSRTTDYDYAHPVYDDKGTATYGVAVQIVEYYDGEQSRITRYAWMNSAEQYIKTLEEYAGSRMEATETADGYRTVTYASDGTSGAWTKTAEEEFYVIKVSPGVVADGGSLRTSYYDGQASVSGYKTTYAANTPEAGWSQWISYSYNAATKTWTPSARKDKFGVVGNDDLNEAITGSKAVLRYYRYTNGAWNFYATKIYEQVKDSLWHISLGQGQNGYYAIRSANGEFDECTMLSATTGYILYGGDSEGSYAYEFTTAGLTGKTLLIKQERVALPFAPDYSFNISVLMGKTSAIYDKDADGKWQPRREWDVMSQGETPGGAQATVRTHYTRDAEGRFVQISDYFTPTATAGATEFEGERLAFEYADREATCTYSVTYSTKNPVLKIDRKYVYSLLDDGTLRSDQYEYENGKVDYRYRTDHKDGITTNYKYNAATDELTVSGQDLATNYSKTDADGKLTNYVVEYDANNVPTFVSKTESQGFLNDPYCMTASYTYDKATGKWVGESKSESYHYSIPFKWYENPIDPLGTYDDSYAPIPAGDGDSYGRSRQLNEAYEYNYTKQYSWDAAKDDWVRTDGTADFSYEMPDAHTLVLTGKADYGNIIDETIKTNGNYDPVQHVTVKRNTNEEGTETETSTTSYTYNERGWLTSSTDENKMVHRDGYQTENKLETVYTYTQLSILPTAIDRVSAAAMRLTVSGNTITAPEGTAISLYDTAGRLAAKGVGSVTVMAKGIYVVKTAAGTSKVMVK